MEATTLLSLDRFQALDLSRMFPGPYTTHILADLGMDVVRVEELAPRFGMGRDALAPSSPTPELEERYAAYNSVGRNKRSVALDLLDPKKRPQSQEVFYKLAEKADVIVEGYRPGAVKWMGVDYETIRKINPRIIYCSLTGFGQTGPYAPRPGHGGQFDALGASIVLGDDGKPASHPAPLGDLSGALHASTCIVAALLHREFTGEGQYIDVSLSAAALALMPLRAAAQSRGDMAQPRPPALGLQFLQCKDGKWLSTGNAETTFWENFCKVLGHPEWIPLRRSGTPEYDAMLAEAHRMFRTRTRSEWLEILVKAETCVAPVYDIEESLADPQMQHVGMAVNMQHPKFGNITQLGFPARLNGQAVGPGKFAPLLGQHTREVLREVGFSGKQIDDLIGAGIVKSPTE